MRSRKLLAQVISNNSSANTSIDEDDDSISQNADTDTDTDRVHGESHNKELSVSNSASVGIENRKPKTSSQVGDQQNGKRTQKEMSNIKQEPKDGEFNDAEAKEAHGQNGVFSYPVGDSIKIEPSKYETESLYI